jgi:hypothetical protein
MFKCAAIAASGLFEVATGLLYKKSVTMNAKIPRKE